MILYATTLACAAALAILIYRYDLYEREPRRLLLATVLLGMGFSWSLGLIESVALARLGIAASPAGPPAVAAVCEETAKLLAVVVVALAFRRHFNDPMDGLLYGAFAGLGMGVEESFFYLGMPSSLPLGPIAGREATRLLLHMLLGGIDGFGLGMARFRMRGWPAVLAGWIALSMALHFGWDFACGYPASSAAAHAFLRAAVIALLLTATALFGASTVYASGWSRAVHDPASTRRLWRPEG